jgi:hypothetical protein
VKGDQGSGVRREERSRAKLVSTGIRLPLRRFETRENGQSFGQSTNAVCGQPGGVLVSDATAIAH